MILLCALSFTVLLIACQTKQDDFNKNLLKIDPEKSSALINHHEIIENNYVYKLIDLYNSVLPQDLQIDQIYHVHIQKIYIQNMLYVAIDYKQQLINKVVIISIEIDTQNVQLLHTYFHFENYNIRLFKDHDKVLVLNEINGELKIIDVENSTIKTTYIAMNSFSNFLYFHQGIFYQCTYNGQEHTTLSSYDYINEVDVDLDIYQASELFYQPLFYVDEGNTYLLEISEDNLIFKQNSLPINEVSINDMILLSNIGIHIHKMLLKNNLHLYQKYIFMQDQTYYALLTYARSRTDNDEGYVSLNILFEIDFVNHISYYIGAYEKGVIYVVLT